MAATRAPDGKRVMVMTFGSRGDNQPHAAFAAGLKAAGFEVLATTNTNAVPLFAGLGVAARGVHFDIEAWLRTDEKIGVAMARGSPMAFGEAMGSKLAGCFPVEFCAQWEAAQVFRPDMITSCTLTYLQASAIAQALGVPCVLADLGTFSMLPITRNELMCTELNETRWHNWAAFALLSCMKVQFCHLGGKNSLRNVIRATLKAEIGEAPLLGEHAANLVYEWMQPVTIQFFATSPLVLPKFEDLPALYASRTHWTGFWTVPKSLQLSKAQHGDAGFGGSEVAAAVDKFIAEGGEQPPAYLGWGSMIAVSPAHMADLAVRSLKLAGLRGIILGGFAKLQASLLTDPELVAYAERSVLFLQAAPHEWLFPRSAVIVHHGGAGTTAAALRAGVPSIITPCLADQPNNARIVQSRGVGIAMPQFSKVSAEALAAALVRCTTNGAMQAAAKELGNSLREEDGVGTAVKLLHRFMAEDVASGKWRAEFEARLHRRRAPPVGCFGLIVRMCCSAAPFGSAQEKPGGLSACTPPKHALAA